MEYVKVKFPKKLFKKKVLVLDSLSTQDYDYLKNEINFDPLYFLEPDNNDPKTIERLFRLAIIGSAKYASETYDTYFEVDAGLLETVSYRSWKKITQHKFIIKRPNGSLFVMLIFKDM